MNKILQIIIISAISTLSHAQAPLVKLWDNTIGGTEPDLVEVILECNDGGYIAGGFSFSDSSGDKTQDNWGGITFADYWIVKTDINGNKLWDKRYGGTGTDALSKMIKTSDGGYLLTGSSNSGINGDKTESPWAGSVDYWAVKIDSVGNKLWDKRFGGTGDDWCYSAIEIPGGNFIISGSSYSGVGGNKTQANWGSSDFWVVKISSSGTLIWEKRFGGTDADNTHALIYSVDGSFLIGGTSSSGISGDRTQNSRGFDDYWLLKVDTLGNKIWDKRFGGGQSDELMSMLQTPDGGYLIGGSSSSPASPDKTQASFGNYDYWVLKIDSAGIKVWDKIYGGTDKEEQEGTLIRTQDGNYVISGSSYSPLSGNKSEANLGFEQAWLMKFDGAGNVVNDKTIFTIGHDEHSQLIQAADGCYVLCIQTDAGIGGYKTESPWGLYFDYWLIKMCDTTVVPNNNCSFTVNAGSDSSFCNTHTVQLAGSSSLANGDIQSILWQPSAGLSDTTIFNPTATVNVTTTYTLTVTSALDTNLVFNGDFSLGDTGFATGYVPGQGGISGIVSDPFDYDINTNPHNSHIDFATYGDHTTGTGNMLIANGADQFNIDLWCQTVNVTPFQNYNYSAWATACNWQNPAQLQFTINGIPVGSTLYLTTDTGTWLPFTTTWNADTNTTATICITDLSTWSAGNDFAVDDISFTGACSQTDSVTIFIQPVAAINIGADTTVCNSDSVLITAPTGFAQYQWQYNGTLLSFSGNTIYANQQGIYSLLADDGTGCNAADTVQVNFRTAAVALGNDLVVCNFDSIAINAGIGFSTYNWFLNGNNLSFNSPSIYASQAGQYVINVTDSVGCAAADTLLVSLSSPAVTVGNDITLCNGADTTLNATQGFDHYLWSLNNNPLVDTTAGITASQQGNYIVVVTDSIGCTASDTVFITVNTLVVNLGNDTSVCANQQAIIIATGATGTYSWLYNNTPLSFTDDSITVSQQGQYNVNVTSTAGCTAKDSFNLTVNALPQVSTIADAVICDAGSVTLTTTGAAGYSWSPSTYLSSSTGAAPVSTPLNSITYIVTGTDTSGCTNTDTVNISFATSPVADFDFTASFNCSGVEISTQNNSSNATSYRWNFNDGFTTIETDVVHTYNTVNNTPIQLIAFNNECTDTLIKPVAFISPTFTDSLSNVFTPNNDGLNDCFVITVPPSLKDCYSLIIYNRWGQNVFKADDDELCWDGTINNGKKANEGIYYYILRIADEVYHGTVTLFR